MLDFMNNGVSSNRKNDPISGVIIFSHGMPGAISFGYHQDNENALLFKAEQIQKLNQGIFKSNAYFTLYTCRSGSTLNGATNFAQTLADWTGVNVKGTYSSNDSIHPPEFTPYERPTTEGRTDYTYINGLTEKRYWAFIALYAGSEYGQKEIERIEELYKDTLEHEQNDTMLLAEMKSHTHHYNYHNHQTMRLQKQILIG